MAGSSGAFGGSVLPTRNTNSDLTLAQIAQRYGGFMGGSRPGPLTPFLERLGGGPQGEAPPRPREPTPPMRQFTPSPMPSMPYMPAPRVGPQSIGLWAPPPSPASPPPLPYRPRTPPPVSQGDPRQAPPTPWGGPAQGNPWGLPSPTFGNQQGPVTQGIGSLSNPNGWGYGNPQTGVQMPWQNNAQPAVGHWNPSVSMQPGFVPGGQQNHNPSSMYGALPSGGGTGMQQFSGVPANAYSQGFQVQDIRMSPQMQYQNWQRQQPQTPQTNPQSVMQNYLARIPGGGAAGSDYATWQRHAQAEQNLRAQEAALFGGARPAPMNGGAPVRPTMMPFNGGLPVRYMP